MRLVIQGIKNVLADKEMMDSLSTEEKLNIYDLFNNQLIQENSELRTENRLLRETIEPLKEAVESYENKLNLTQNDLNHKNTELHELKVKLAVYENQETIEKLMDLLSEVSSLLDFY